MRIVVDMQGAQTESRFRGIGRYTLSLVLALVRNRGEHEVLLALNSLFPDTIEPIRAAFDGVLPQQNIRVWYSPGPTRESNPSNSDRREIAEKIREAFIESLQPNVVLLTSLFEGLGDDAVTSVGCFDKQTPVAVVLYDLIPLVSPDVNFRTNLVYKNYYARKIKSLKNSALLLAISESSRNEAITGLSWDSDRVVNILSGYDVAFKPIAIPDSEARDFLHGFGVTKPYLMYTGGADERKNLPGLIQAFGQLSPSLRRQYQLLLVGKMPEDIVDRFKGIARKAGLSIDEVVFTGYVAESDLHKLYSLCDLFVFPSLHEGFGLPPLEAMACGAPVITSNVTSLPEVMGRADATFDPGSSEAIAEKIEVVLKDDDFRRSLGRYGVERASLFSWDMSAIKAIAVMEKIQRKYSTVHDVENIGLDRPRELSTGVFSGDLIKKILVSKLDHMGDWILAIPAISKLRARYPHAEMDALVGNWNVEAAKALNIFKKVYSFDYFSKKSAAIPWLKEKALTEIIDRMPQYDLAIDLRRQQDTRAILLKVPSKRYVGYTTADQTINEKLDVHLEGEADERFVKTALNLTPISLQMTKLVDAIPSDVNDYVFLPEMCSPIHKRRGQIAIFPRAGNDVKEWGDHNFLALIEMLLQADDVHRVTIYTVSPEEGLAYANIRNPKFQNEQDLSHSELLKSLSGHSICVSNNSYGGHIASYLGLSVVGVYGGHETPQEWGPAFSKSVVVYVPVACSPCHIATREHCVAGMKCLEIITPSNVYAVVRRMLDSEDSNDAVQKTVDDVVDQLIESVAPYARSFNDEERIALASCIDLAIARARRARWYVDISELVRIDAKSGIQRVVRSILKCWLEAPPAGVDIVPVYGGDSELGYRRAALFLKTFTGRQGKESDIDDWVDFQAGDVFIGLDLNLSIVAQQGFLRRIRNHGVSTYFVVYDMLPVKMPDCFVEGTMPAFDAWLRVISEANGALCISRAVEIELSDWLSTHKTAGGPGRRSFQLEWFHLGADIDNSQPTVGLPADWQPVEAMMRRAPSFLMVGTLEPRKGHAEVLDAFEKLWIEGVDASLVIVGKKGWRVEAFVERLHEHPERLHRLVWLDAVSDECLQRVYSEADCLIAASLGEGFGLPLIEAAQHGLPILARDIPVFREVAGDYATYFGTAETPDLAGAIKNWLKSYTDKRERSSVGMPFMTWKQSAEMLAELILSKTKSQSISSDASILTVSVQPTNSPNRALA